MIPTFEAREPPLEPRAVAGLGAAAKKLGARLLQLPEERLAALEVMAGEELLVALGKELPWADGVIYLGSEPDAPGLLLPTTRKSDLCAALLERAARRQANAQGLIALLPDQGLLVPLALKRAASRQRLEAWLKGER